jgi:hypothetical protein
MMCIFVMGFLTFMQAASAAINWLRLQHSTPSERGGSRIMFRFHLILACIFASLLLASLLVGGSVSTGTDLPLWFNTALWVVCIISALIIFWQLGREIVLFQRAKNVGS